MSYALCPQPKIQFFDSNGNPLSGGKVYFYAGDGTTSLTIIILAKG